MIFDLIIVGAGPAGLAAGIYARERRLNTLILEAGESGGQLISLYPDKGVVDYPGCILTKASKLAQRMISHAKYMGCEIHEGERVKEIIDGTDHLIVRTEKGDYPAKAVIIAIGIGLFKPKKLGIPGEEEFCDRGVFYKLPDRKMLLGKRILFVGGGNSALEMALMASEVAKTYIVHRRERFRADESVVEEVNRYKISTIMKAQLKAIQGEKWVNMVIIEREEDEDLVLDVDFVVINIGFSPDLEQLEKWNLRLEKTQIVVDTEMRTSRKGIFACGDVVYYPGKYKQIVTGCGEGATAANSAYKYIKKPYWA